MEMLKGVRVIDFSWGIAGPYATTLLAFMGAEVIKVESMRHFDFARRWLDIGGRTSDWGVNRSVAFNVINLNKMGIRLNLRHPKGIELAKKLIGISDVVVEGFSPEVAFKLGLSYETLKEIKSDIILLSVTMSGITGPEASYRGYAPSFAALGGLGQLTGYPDGSPTEIRSSVDTIVAYTDAFAILAALNHRLRTGQGQFIDVSGREAVSCLVGDSLMAYTMNGKIQSRTGNADSSGVPYNCYRCKGSDKWVSIAIGTEEEWKAFRNVLGHAEWTKEDRFSDRYQRWQNQEELDKLIEEWTINYTAYEVMEMLQKKGIAAVPSFTIEELLSSSHLKERSLFPLAEHPEVGTYLCVGSPWKFSSTPSTIINAAPLLDQHNQHVFSELLGMSKEEIAALEQEGVFD